MLSIYFNGIAKHNNLNTIPNFNWLKKQNRNGITEHLPSKRDKRKLINSEGRKQTDEKKKEAKSRLYT